MITQFYVVEIQQNAAGEFAHIVHWAYDADPGIALQKAWSQYYTVLAAAAVSEMKAHSAILFSTEGFPIAHECFRHDVAAPAEE